MSYIDLLRAKFQFQSGGGFESCFVGNPDDRFSHGEAQIYCPTDKGERHMLSDMATYFGCPEAKKARFYLQAI